MSQIVITPWLKEIVEYHTHYVMLDNTEAPKNMKDLIKILVSKQTTSKNICPGCNYDMGEDWYSQYCSHSCIGL